MNTTYRNRLFFLICICLPFLFVPKVLQFTFIGGPIGTELVVLPILFSYLYTFYCLRKDKYIFIDWKKFAIFSITYVFFLFVSLIHGLYIYPYYDLIFNGPANQIEKLPGVLAFFHSHGMMISQEKLLDTWIVGRFFKGILLEMVYTFGFSYIMYCWFKKDPSVAVKILQKSIYIIVCIIAVYSFFELFYFFGYTWAKNVLVNVNPLLHAIKENFGWWPPLLWDSPRIRSIFPEPSQFGMYAAFFMPFIWIDILNKKRPYVKMGMAGIMSVLMFLSLSKTSTALLLLEVGLLILFLFIRQKKSLIQPCVSILIIIIVSFGINIVCLSNYGNRPFDRITDVFSVNNGEDIPFSYKEGITGQYVQNNIEGITNEKEGSNGTRFAIIKNDIRVGKDNFIFGVGSNLKGAYTTNYFTDDESVIPEIHNCKNLQHTQGILKTGYPNVSEYSQRFAENGIIGLLIYILPIFILSFVTWRNRKKYSYTDEEINMLACTFISLIGCFASGGSGVLTTIHTYWILLGIMFAYVMIPKNNDTLTDRQ